MSDGPTAQGGERTTDAGPKPSIAEVAAWLRRAAEQRDSIEDLRPAPRAAVHQGPPAAAGSNSGQAGPAVADQEPVGRLPDPPPNPDADTEAANEVREEQPAARDGVDEAPSELPPHGAPHDQGQVDADALWRAEDPATTEVPVVEDHHAVEVPVVELASEDEPAEAPGPPADEAVGVPEPPPDEALADQAPATPVQVEEEEAVAPPSSRPHLADGPGDDRLATEAQHPDHAGAALLDLAPPEEELEPADRDAIRSARPDEGALVEDLPAGEAALDAPEVDRHEAADLGAPADADRSHPGDPADLDRHEVPPDGRPSSAAASLDQLPPEPAPDEPTAPAGADAADAGTNAATSVEPDPPEAPMLVDRDLEVTPERDSRPDAGPEARPPRPPAPAPGLQALSSGGSSVASLFDLDLAELASRARANAEARMASISPPSGLHPGTDAGSHGAEVHQVDRGDQDGQPLDLRDDVHDVDVDLDGDLASHAGAGGEGQRSSVLAPPDAEVEPPFDHTSALEPDDSIDLVWEGASDRTLVHGDVELDEERDEDAVVVHDDDSATSSEPAKAKLSSVAGSAATVLRARRAKRKRYPRGQLKEKIGLLRRVRAMLGVVVLTIVLGVAAGAAIGAFLLFLAFAIRGAITSS